MKGETTMKKLAMKMLSLLLVLSLLLPTCVFAQPGQDGDGTPGTQSTTSEETTTPTGGGNSENVDTPTGGGNGDEDADAPTGGGNGDGNGDGDTKDVNGGSVTQSTTSEKTTTFTEGEDGDTPTEEPIVATVSIAVAAEDDDDDFSQEELLEGYLYSISGLYGEGAAVFRAPSKPLPVETQQVYDELQPMVLGVANGTGTTTEFAITKTWTKDRGASGWGIPDSDTIFTTNAEGKTVLTAAASEAIGKFLDVDALMQRMLSTMPYELYWFDKTGGHGMQVTYGASLSGSNLTVSGLKISMWVAQTYATHNGDGTYKPFTPNTTVTSAASTAVDNAKKIVEDNKTKSDYEKLKAYLEKICELVSYNDAAAGSSGYGDPWQLIYVFDNNSSTNVVCEGYAKAFKYLCDLTWPGVSPAVECYLVTGTMSGGKGAGPHMWNVVHIGVNNYLVDVTNCDAGTIGAKDKLFLCGVQEDVASQKYTATSATAGVSSNVEYEYDAQTINDYEPAELKLSGVKYDASTLSTLEITANTIGTGKRHGDKIQQSELTVKATYANGTNVADFKDYTIVYNGGSTTALKKGDNTITVKSGTVESVSINVTGVGGQILTAADFDIKNPNVVTYDPTGSLAATNYGILTNGAVSFKDNPSSTTVWLHNYG